MNSSTKILNTTYGFHKPIFNNIDPYIMDEKRKILLDKSNYNIFYAEDNTKYTPDLDFRISANMKETIEYNMKRNLVDLLDKTLMIAFVLYINREDKLLIPSILAALGVTGFQLFLTISTAGILAPLLVSALYNTGIIIRALAKNKNIQKKLQNILYRKKMLYKILFDKRINGGHKGKFFLLFRRTFMDLLTKDIIYYDPSLSSDGKMGQFFVLKFDINSIKNKIENFNIKLLFNFTAYPIKNIYAENKNTNILLNTSIKNNSNFQFNSILFNNNSTEMIEKLYLNFNSNFARENTKENNEKDEIEVFNLDITQLGTKIYNFKNNNNNIYNTKYLELLKKKRINITLRYSIFPSKENSIELENINKKIKEIENKLKKVTKKNSGNLLGIRK